MKRRVNLSVLLIVASAASAQAQTLFVPTGGLGTSLNNGKVGIGTASPSEALEVNGAQRGTSDIYTTYGISNFRVGFLNPGTAPSPSTYFGLYYDTTNNIGVLGGLTGGGAWRGVSLSPNGGNVGVVLINPSLPFYVRASPNTTGIAWNMGVNNPANPTNAGFGVGIKLQNSIPESGPNELHKWAGIAAVANTPWSNLTDLVFYTNSYDAPTNTTSDGGERMRIQSTTGNVGIGTTNPTEKLSVNGTIRAKEIVVDTSWSDYVFAAGYRLAPLSEVAESIKREGHLPGIPSARDVAEKGINIGATQAQMLAKIEELTLHEIELEKRLDAQEEELHALRDRKKLSL